MINISSLNNVTTQPHKIRTKYINHQKQHCGKGSVSFSFYGKFDEEEFQILVL